MVNVQIAEILNLKKFDLITLYGRLGLPYFNQSKKELEEDLQNIKAIMGREKMIVIADT